MPLCLDTVHQPVFVTVRRAVYDRSSLDTVIASKLTHSVMVQDGSIGGYVKCPVAWNKLPNEVIACLNHKLGPTQIL